MKPNLTKTDASNPDNICAKLNRLLTSLDFDNFNARIISGVTDSVANTQRLFRHGMSPRPRAWIPIAGDVWSPVDGIDNINIDIRSTQTSMPFQIYVVS